MADFERTQVFRAATPGLTGHLAICRFDHWVKNVFVLPGIVIALSAERPQEFGLLAWNIVVGLLCTGLIASSNYVINEIMDAPFDLTHPTKRNRPVPSGRVNIPLAYVQWLGLMVAGLWIGWQISFLPDNGMVLGNGGDLQHPSI